MKPGQPGTFLFRLERQKPDSDIDGNDNEDTSRLKIIFTYRSVEADLLAVLRPHLQAMLEKHDAKPSRRLIEAVSSYLLFNRKLLNRFYSLHLLDSLGSSDLFIGEDDVQPAIKDSTRLKEYLRTYWTSDDEWDRIQNAIAEACQVCIISRYLYPDQT